VKQIACDYLFERLLTEPDHHVRDALTAALILIWVSRGDDRATLALVRHPNPNVRFAAAQFLGLTTTDGPDDEDNRAALAVLVTDPDEGVRRWAQFGLDTLML
jgi:HEAT repeat protein